MTEIFGRAEIFGRTMSEGLIPGGWEQQKSNKPSVRLLLEGNFLYVHPTEIFRPSTSPSS